MYGSKEFFKGKSLGGIGNSIASVVKVAASLMDACYRILMVRKVNDSVR